MNRPNRFRVYSAPFTIGTTVYADYLDVDGNTFFFRDREHWIVAAFDRSSVDHILDLTSEPRTVWPLPSLGDVLNALAESLKEAA